MIEIPIELFALFNAIALIFVPIGLVTRKDGFGYVILMTTGMFISLFALATDIIFAPSYGFTTTYNNSTDTIINVPIPYEFTDLTKVLFVLIGSFVSTAGAFLLVRDK